MGNLSLLQNLLFTGKVVENEHGTQKNCKERVKKQQEKVGKNLKKIIIFIFMFYYGTMRALQKKYVMLLVNY